MTSKQSIISFIESDALLSIITIILLVGISLYLGKQVWVLEEKVGWTESMILEIREEIKDGKISKFKEKW